MKKELIVNGNSFIFFLFEEFNIWRCIENSSFIEGFDLDLEIEAKSFEWEDIENFILFLINDFSIKFKNINSAKRVLNCYYSELYNNSQLEIENIDFKISSIVFKGYCNNINIKNQFEYDFYFYPIDTKNSNRDLGTFNWCANFRNNLFLGVFCDRM